MRFATAMPIFVERLDCCRLVTPRWEVGGTKTYSCPKLWYTRAVAEIAVFHRHISSQMSLRCPASLLWLPGCCALVHWFLRSFKSSGSNCAQHLRYFLFTTCPTWSLGLSGYLRVVPWKPPLKRGPTMGLSHGCSSFAPWCSPWPFFLGAFCWCLDGVKVRPPSLKYWDAGGGSGGEPDMDLELGDASSSEQAGVFPSNFCCKHFQAPQKRRWPVWPMPGNLERHMPCAVRWKQVWFAGARAFAHRNL